MLVSEFLERSAASTPDAVALVCGQRRLTYREVDDASTRVAHGLRRLGLGRGDRVVIHLDNRVEAVLALFGTLKAGGVFVVINPTVKADKLTYLLSDCQATILVSDVRSEVVVGEVWRDDPALEAMVFVGTEAGAPLPSVPVPVLTFEALLEPPRETLPEGGGNIDIDLAALVYTSGSTGRTKGVMLTHGNIVAAATSIADYLRMGPDDVVLNLLPLSFDYGLYQVFLTFKTGGRLILERSFAYPSRILELVAREQVTGLPIVPMLAAILVKQDLAGHDLSRLRFISNTGAVLPPEHIAVLRRYLPHVRIYSMYGLTECKRVSFLSPEEVDARPTSVGKAMDNCEVYLVTEDGRRIDSGVGELVIRGSNVMQGYWGAPEITARVLKPGVLPGQMVLYSGDIFRIDDDGFMYFVSRTDDIIKSRGLKVSPREVEGVLAGIPGVSEAAVVGVPDPILGEAIKAYVTLDGSVALTEQDILRHCANRLEDFMVPKAAEIVTTLPRTTSGKISRRVLAEPAAPPASPPA